jgi:hypothetical protein
MIFAALPDRGPDIGKSPARWWCRDDKVLNQRTESKRDGHVAIPTTDKNNFTFRLRLEVPADRFQSAARHYADK